jgi:hypothetical protein
MHINVRMNYYRLPPAAVRSLIQPTDALWYRHSHNITERFRGHFHQIPIFCDLQYACAQCVGLEPWLRRKVCQIMQPVAFCYHPPHTSFIRYSLPSRSTDFSRSLFWADDIEDLGANNPDGFYSPFLLNRWGSAFITATFSMLAWQLWGWLKQWGICLRCWISPIQYPNMQKEKEARDGTAAIQSSGRGRNRIGCERSGTTVERDGRHHFGHHRNRKEYRL